MDLRLMTGDEICKIGEFVRGDKITLKTKEELMVFAKDLLDLDFPKWYSKKNMLDKILRTYSIRSSYLILLDSIHDNKVIEARLKMSNDLSEVLDE